MENRNEPTPAMQRQAISNVQQYLRQISMNLPGCTVPPQDGIWGSDTEQSLREFQRRSHIPETGTADPATMEALHGAYLDSLEQTSPAAPVPVFPEVPPTSTLGPGSPQFQVLVLQHMLEALSLIYHFPALQINGTYDQPTADAVRTFQEASDLPITGRVDRLTWNRLVAQYGSTNPAE